MRPGSRALACAERACAAELTQLAFDYMPTRNLTFRLEFNHRHANVPYFAGEGGLTPEGGNSGDPTLPVPGFQPDLEQDEDRLTLAMLFRL